jgi:hypothetical protein
MLVERCIPALVIAVALSACTGGSASETTIGSVTTTTTAAAPATAGDGISTTSVTAATSPTPSAGDTTEVVAEPFTERRTSMVDRQIVDRLIHDSVVIEAMRVVPRHEFVPTDFVDQAYGDHPLPIGHGQTISQPYIVALMSQALDLGPGAKVLEIGTGSGYQARWTSGPGPRCWR